MLRNLFIIMLAVGFLFVIYSATAQNANATCPPGDQVCEVECLVGPTCFCTFGGRAQNHTTYTSCNLDPGWQYGILRFAPTADCDDDNGVVVPPTVNPAGENYCRQTCYCNSPS